jgi:hypothetical protein
LKSTIIHNWFALLLINVLLYQFVRDVSRAHRKIAPRPEMPAPKLLSQIRKLGQQNSRAYPFQPLHDFAYVLIRAIRDKHVHMIARYLARNNFNLVLQSNLAQNISGADCHLADENPFSIFRNPYQMYLQIRLGMGTNLLTSHSDNGNLFFA